MVKCFIFHRPHFTCKIKCKLQKIIFDWTLCCFKEISNHLANTPQIQAKYPQHMGLVCNQAYTLGEYISSQHYHRKHVDFYAQQHDWQASTSAVGEWL